MKLTQLTGRIILAGLLTGGVAQASEKTPARDGTVYPDARPSATPAKGQGAVPIHFDNAFFYGKNNEDDKCMLMDMFLLHGQMLPEHWHLDGDKNPAKREGWLVRWGLSHIVGEGDANLGKDVVIPQ